MEFIVAPYEADAQMAYLALNGMVHAVSPILTSGNPSSPNIVRDYRGMSIISRHSALFLVCPR